MTVGLLYREHGSSHNHRSLNGSKLDDNWIYVQEPGVKVGRVQVFDNWSPYMVASPDTTWFGLEFFCTEGDELWNKDDADLIALARKEMAQIGLAATEDCLDGVVIRMQKAYPGYYGAYEHFPEIRTYVDLIPNLFLIGRNGMHRYNNQDHSMLSAKFAVEAIVSGSTDKTAIWSVNIDDDYHEEATFKETQVSTPAVKPITVIN
jgi:protoporphyrinogen oxidase